MSLEPLTHPQAASILRLPVELTAEIFIHCLPELHQNNPRLSEAPLLLGRICRQWRHVALSTPRLWCFLTVNDVVSFSSQEALLDYAETWLSRTRNCPLFIDISVGSTETPLKPLIAILSAHSAQWLQVNLTIPYTFFHAFAFPAGLPILNRITVEASFMDGEDEKVITVFQGATQLRQAHLSWTNCHESTPIMALPWVQLTSFTGRSLTVKECFMVLTEAAALCCLLSICERHAPRPLHPLVSALEILQLECGPTASPSSLWAALTMSHLRHLRTVCYPCAAFQAFLARSSAHLRDVGLRQSTTSPALLRGCLAAMPAVSSLRLLDIHPPCIVALIAFLRESPATHFPRLTALEVTNIVGHSENFAYGPLVDMLASRRLRPGAGAARLERFTFTWVTSSYDDSDEFAVHAGVLVALAPLIEDGLEVVIGPQDELNILRRSWT
ncbi:hypothetical protein B0H17DRAFT_1327883 [Mycena rosella]|uniref:F-box domain-containing protein n=1 Tax=Mycena rosella TaxID=1033263 RepID=A0AAD7DYE5_MYCRO|nr:hypothetical protein B0H17DRAFT_1327883 [Mycena rosella]